MRTASRRHANPLFSATIGFLAAGAILGLAGCVSVPPRDRAAAREAAYFATRPEVPPSVATAIHEGHIVLGMTREQVWVVLGDPVYKRVFGRARATEIWLFPAHRLHQDQLRAHGMSSFRLTFRAGRLVVIEPV